MISLVLMSNFPLAKRTNMPTNKNAYLRFRIIDECLRNKNKYFNRHSIADRISDKLGYNVSVNAIDKDIRALKEEFDAPIKYDKFQNRYYYAHSFSLASVELNHDEEDALNLSLSILDILKETKYAKSYKNLIQKLVTRATKGENDGIIEFEQTPVQLDSSIFDALYDAIKRKEALVITYQVYGKQRKNHTVSPYMIKEYRNRFYLVAREHLIQNDNELIFCFGMDRIKSVAKAKEPFLVTLGFTPKDFFKHSFGISRDLLKEPMTLVLKFSNLIAPYILSKPLHPSQQIVEQTEAYLTVSIVVFESFELNMAILGYGSRVEVLSPKSYIDYLKNEINGMNQIYRKR